jgi:hypothetical protein
LLIHLLMVIYDLTAMSLSSMPPKLSTFVISAPFPLEPVPISGEEGNGVELDAVFSAAATCITHLSTVANAFTAPKLLPTDSRCATPSGVT